MRTTTDAPHVLRDVAEQSATQAKESLETMNAALKGTQDYSAKVLEFAQANINAAVEHVTKLSSAKRRRELVAIRKRLAK